jgi:hypothetical protein
MTDGMNSLCARLVAARLVSDDDILALRRAIWQGDMITPPVVDALFAINDSLSAPSNAFSDLFGEAITHYLLRQEWPHDFMSDANALWLEERINRDGRIESHAELELMVRILEKAENAPDHLKDWTLSQIETCILTGAGPTRFGSEIRPGSIDAVEVALLRRLIFAAGGASALAVSDTEAEMLFRIKDATIGQENAPEWKTLFVQAVANHLMAYAEHEDVSLERARELNTFMNDQKPHIGEFLMRVVNSISLRAIIQRPVAIVPTDHAAAVTDANRIAGDEAAWLKRQIVADTQVDDLEKAVLAFIVDEGVELPGALAILRQSA